MCEDSREHEEVVDRVRRELEDSLSSGRMDASFDIVKVDEWDSPAEVGARYEVRLPTFNKSLGESVLEALDRFDYWELAGTRVTGNHHVVFDCLSSEKLG